MALMHSEAVEVRNMNIRDKPPAGAPAAGKRPGGPRGLLPWGSHGSVRALSGIRLFIS